MQEKIYKVENEGILRMLREIPQPPKMLYMRGGFAAPHHKLITIVGSRNCSQYGIQVVEEICKSLEGQPVSIVSGLATGIDAHAHKFALKYNLHTIAIMGSGISDFILQKHANYKLAYKILDSGGALISEYKPKQESRSWMFPARNRIMVGISHLIIVIEARKKSGTSITARLATDYNKDLITVPNSIYMTSSSGSNELIKQGAYVYTEPKDIFDLLKLDFNSEIGKNYSLSNDEKIIVDAISSGQNKTQDILDACSDLLTTSQVIQIILNLEIEGVIKRVDGVYTILSF